MYSSPTCTYTCVQVSLVADKLYWEYNNIHMYMYMYSTCSAHYTCTCTYTCVHVSLVADKLYCIVHVVYTIPLVAGTPYWVYNEWIIKEIPTNDKDEMLRVLHYQDNHQV